MDPPITRTAVAHKKRATGRKREWRRRADNECWRTRESRTLDRVLFARGSTWTDFRIWCLDVIVRRAKIEEWTIRCTSASSLRQPRRSVESFRRENAKWGEDSDGQSRNSYTKIDGRGLIKTDGKSSFAETPKEKFLLTEWNGYYYGTVIKNADIDEINSLDNWKKELCLQEIIGNVGGAR